MLNTRPDTESETEPVRSCKVAQQPEDRKLLTGRESLILRLFCCRRFLFLVDLSHVRGLKTCKNVPTGFHTCLTCTSVSGPTVVSHKKNNSAEGKKKSSPENFYPRFTHGKQFSDKKQQKKTQKLF